MKSLYYAIRKEAWQIAWPIMLASLSNNLIGLTDTAFLSRISLAALGGGGLAVLWLYSITSIAMGWGTAVQIMVARALGEKDLPFAHQQFLKILMPSFFIALLQFALLYFSPPALQSFFDSHPIYYEFEQYLRIRSIDAFPMTFYFVFRGFYNATSQNKIIGYTAFLLFFVNFILNYVLGFGFFIIPPLGSKGIALASVISQFVSVAILALNFVYVLKLPIRLAFRSTDKVVYGEMFKLSLPVSFQNAISIGSFFVFIKITEYLGSYSLAVSEITKNIYILLMIPTWGYGTAASTIISRTIGEGNKRLVIPIVKIIGYQNFMLGLVPIVLLLAYPQLYYFLLTDDGKIIREAVPIARVVAVALLIYSFAWIWVSAVIGTGATYVAFAMEIITLCLYLSYIVLTYHFTKNLFLIWFCEILYMMVMVAISYFYIKSNRWQKLKISFSD